MFGTTDVRYKHEDRNITMEAATCKGFRFLSVASDCKTKTYVRNSGEDER